MCGSFSRRRRERSLASRICPSSSRSRYSSNVSMDSFPHVAKPVSVLLHESNDTANFAILEAVVIADAYEGGPTVQVNDQFASSRRNVNVRRKMVVQID